MLACVCVCLCVTVHRDSEEFSRCLQRALREDPQPLSPHQLHDLTWEAATERFLDVAEGRPEKGIVTALETGMDNALAGKGLWHTQTHTHTHIHARIQSSRRFCSQPY